MDIDDSFVTASSSSTTPSNAVDETGSTSTLIEKTTSSRSEMKLLNTYNWSDDSTGSDSDSSCDSDNESGKEDLEGHRIINISTLNSNIQSQLVCGFCHGMVELREVKRVGLASDFAFHCKNSACNRQRSFSSCDHISIGNLSVKSVNRRAVLAMRCVGGGHADLKTFCGLMDLPSPVRKSSYNLVNKTMQKAAATVQRKSMQKAAEIEF